MNQISATVLSNKKLTKGSELPQTNLLCLKSPEIASIAQPGQFVMMNCGTDVTLRRPLSIHHIDKSGQIYFLFMVIGKGTRWLSQRQKGDELDLIGPLGNYFFIKPSSKKILLIAGGIGISPLSFLAHQALKQRKIVSLILGARTKKQLYQQNLPQKRMEIITLTDDGSEGLKGKISDFQSLPAYINQANQIFICGPLPMYQALSYLINQKSSGENVQISLETRMGCGFGACYGCNIKTKHGMKMVCRDGPVFNMKEIIWQEIKL